MFGSSLDCWARKCGDVDIEDEADEADGPVVATTPDEDVVEDTEENKHFTLMFASVVAVVAVASEAWTQN